MFEFVARPSEGPDGKVGAQGTVLAGGSYGGLVGALGGGKHVRGVGWSAGLERLSLLLEEVAAERCAAVEAPPPHVALLPLEGGDEGTGGVGLRLRLAQRLRSGGVAAIGYGGGAALQKRLGKGTRPRAPAARRCRRALTARCCGSQRPPQARATRCSFPLPSPTRLWMDSASRCRPIPFRCVDFGD